MAVIKNVPLEKIFEALEAGITDLGENRVQEALSRNALIRQKYPAAVFHMIGHLQRNKVRQGLDMFDIIQSVDNRRLVEAIARLAERPISILIEVNTAGEASKFGVEPSKAVELVRFASSFDKIKVQGLMTIGPLSSKSRPAFRQLRELRDEIASLDLNNVEMKYLSMGMSGDWEIALEEGSNLIRLGRAIFEGG